MSGSAELAQLAEDYFGTRNEIQPLIAAMMGVDEAPKVQLQDVSEAGDAKTRAAHGELLNRLLNIPTVALDDTELTSHQMLNGLLRQGIQDIDLCAVEFTLDGFLGGPQATLTMLLPRIPIRQPQDAEDYLSRLRLVPRLLEDTLVRLRRGLSKGLTTTEIGTRAAIEQCRGLAAVPWNQHPLLMPMQAAVSVGTEVSAAAIARAQDIIANLVNPALVNFANGAQSAVLPSARPDERVGLCHMVTGEKVYSAALRQHTTTDLNAQQIHEIGLQVIAALEAEYVVLGQKVFGTSDLREIFTRLNQDPALQYATPGDAVTDAQAAVDRASAVANAWIKRTPKKPCVVRPLPAASSKGQAAAYYQPPQGRQGEHGTYWLNIVAPVLRRFECETVAFHEAIPGHHTQIALQAELALPRFRQVGLMLAGYQEGWGLYAERLADEMGLYSSDLARLGMLTIDSLRACRLVIDTGLHHFGWSRQQALAYMKDNAPVSSEFALAEVNRYCVLPGQACSYMIGRREIVRLRTKAEQVLSEAFDVREFHDVVLGQGAVPLSTLATLVDRWIASRVATTAQPLGS